VLHPQCQEVIDRTAAWGDPEEITVEIFRRREVQRFEQLALAPRAIAEVRDLAIPGPVGDLHAIAYRAADRPVGTFVWFHGGGFIGGSAALSDDQARELAVASECVVLSVDYRLAPESPFPAAVHDGSAAVAWAAAHGRELGVASDALAVGGDSAGGNIAAAVTLLARDGGNPRIDHQALMYPLTAHDLDAPSRKQFESLNVRNRVVGAKGWSFYLPVEDDARNPLASPLYADSHEGLPPALIVTAEFDHVRDDGELYAQKLAEAGVTVETRRYDTMFHGFCAYAGVIDEARPALHFIGERVRNALQGATQSA
jgi:acetyl esterase